MSELRILMGDCREGMRTLDAGSVQACVTSPPYWALRDYGVPPTQWEACEFTPMAGLPPVQIPAMECCLGLEPDPLAFVGHMVLVFREVWRVLRDDGVLFMNFGDSAAPSGGAGGLKPKDIVMMPARVALALQADGWTVRQDIIWHKRNPMPESAKDRCTKAHEYIYLMSKGPRYYWDHEAMREPVSGTAHPRGHGVNPKAKWKTPDGWDTTAGEGGHGSIHRKGREKGKVRAKQNESFANAVKGLVTTRNKRSVWTVNPQPYPEAHFATYPEELVRPCVLAATRPGDIVLDPFGGSGTTGRVALEEGRSVVLCELNSEYEPLIRRRCVVTPKLQFT